MSELTAAPSVTTIPKTGYVGRGQDQPGSGSDALTIANQSLNKGGMRGIGLLAIVLAEAALKKESVDLAEDYYRINKKDYEFFVSVHQPAIQQTVTEAMSPVDNPIYQHDYYASAPAGMAKSAILDKQWFETRRRVSRYSIGLQRRIDYDFAIRRLHGIVGGWNIGRRYEMAYADEHNNRRFDRKIEASNIGIGVGNIVRQGLASSTAGLASAYDNLGDTISTIGNGLAANSGYKAGRADTSARYPTQENK
jgi:hypothetical protein